MHSLQPPYYRGAYLTVLDNTLQLTPNPLLRFVARRMLGLDFHPILLPVDGNYIDPETPMTLNVENLRAPFDNFALEFSASPAPGLKQGAYVLLVSLEPSAAGLKQINLWYLSYEHYGDQFGWDVANVGVCIELGNRIEIGPQGIQLSKNLQMVLPPGVETDEEMANRALPNYFYFVCVLARFLWIYRCENVGVRKLSESEQPIHAGNHYELCCKGPTPFTWLPTVKIAQVH